MSPTPQKIWGIREDQLVQRSVLEVATFTSNATKLYQKPNPSTASLPNKGDKLRLQEFLWKEFKSLALDENQEFFYTTREKSVNLKTSAVSPEFSKMLLQYQKPIIIDSDDNERPSVKLSRNAFSRASFSPCTATCLHRCRCN